MEETKNEELAFIEIGRDLYKNPNYKSELIIGNITIRFEKRFNWLNRKMFKLFFGLNITNIRK